VTWDQAVGPALHGLFVQKVAGDDALLRLARLRFDQAGIAAEVYGGTPDELERMLRFAPAQPHLPTVHLDRGLNILRPEDRAAVKEFVSRFAGRVGGLVAHDKPDMAQYTDELLGAMTELGRHAESTVGAPWFFLEYASKLDLEWFAGIARRLRDVPLVSLCVDVGHIGINEARRSFRALHPELDLVKLDAQDPRLPELVDDVQKAVAAALPAVLELTDVLGRIGKRAHFHLHDGHPLTRGLSDHFSFLEVLPVPFRQPDGRYALPPLYGPAGLAAVLERAVSAFEPRRVSLTLEIHQAQGRLPVDDAAGMFWHWSDITNAERCNFWLSVLTQNAVLAASLLDDQGLGCSAKNRTNSAEASGPSGSV
jgi:hypothetical protein